MRVKIFAGVMGALALSAGARTAEEFVSERVLPFAGTAASSSFLAAREVHAADTAADEAWLGLKTKSDYDAYRLSLRAKMHAAMGCFPERTPLNARTVARFQKDGYAVEKVIFESMPSLPVTANLFIPDGAGRRPAVVMSCGHADEGKDANIYLRACVIAAKRGFVALMFDPYFQGERREPGMTSSTRAHCQLGQRAELLDWSMPLLRVWDGMRAIDYAVSRPEVDPDRIGYMGQSGGGTMTALMMAADARIRAAAPSCYLTSLRDLCQMMGPQDAEQNIFGQLAFGLNHTGYVLVPDIPVAVTVKYGDMFPYSGVQTLMKTVRGLETNLGLGERAFLNAAQGPHGWVESTETTSVDFLARALIPACRDRAIDPDANRMLDFGFDLAKADCGLAPAERGCSPEGRTFNVPGAKSPFALLAEKATRARAARKAMTAAERAACVKRLAVFDRPAPGDYLVKSFGAETLADARAEKIVFVRRGSAEALPATLLVPAAAKGAPALVVAFAGRAKGFAAARPLLAAGRPVLLADVSGTGETATQMHEFYGRKDRPDEGLGAMLYLLGQPLVGRRAKEILLLGDYLKTRFGAAPSLVAAGPLAIAAAHAYAAAPADWADVSLVEPPLSWRALLEETPGAEIVATYADLVPHAYFDYDWTDLIDASARR